MAFSFSSNTLNRCSLVVSALPTFRAIAGSTRQANGLFPELFDSGLFYCAPAGRDGTESARVNLPRASSNGKEVIAGKAVRLPNERSDKAKSKKGRKCHLAALKALSP